MINADGQDTSVINETLKELLAARLSPMAPIPTGMPPGGNLQNRLEAILFDVYGTLLISGTGDISVTRESFHASKEFRALLDRFSIVDAPEKILTTFFSEIRNAHKTARNDGITWPEVQIEHIWSRVLDIDDMPLAHRFAMEFELMVNPVWPMPHLGALLAACRKAGLPMGIISNAQFYTPLLLQWFLKSDLTDIGFKKELIIYSYKFGCAKPSTKLFNLAAGNLNKMGISPDAVLYVGNDLQKDVFPAKKAGFQTALFAGDARSLRCGDNAVEPGWESSDLILTDLSQLLPHIPSHVGE